jgi:hypothetical protein
LLAYLPCSTARRPEFLCDTSPLFLPLFLLPSTVSNDLTSKYCPTLSNSASSLGLRSAMSVPSKIYVQQIMRQHVVPVSHTPLHWPNIPLDILTLVIEHSPRELLPTWCRVSKFCNGCAMPALYREVNVQLSGLEGSRPVAKDVLLRLVKGAGRYCRRFTLQVGQDIFESDEGGPPHAAILMHALMSGFGMSTDACLKGLS